ncbi:MAG: Heme biosynthesis protein [Candidatus Shapirobacteria bacterium GW2011_GWE1_38_10]|uniref:Heme biosynthesis protein n=1 Tax=Candidatus Shapirobacteria bacterium GW2011_GWE1_38_10 TaxID=1618488 RepID=A0A0G0I3Z1_9BACT|nr:MAG: Heme biosynthesis protein [Candidatus Shapirobacteria bacterium GW2011_GWF2_37_20]KKQ50058.1 MAG: Heme biosynthesis protein [Candidatus Shapirobacteria bacterium GW2011_GWE1_38_10]
MLKAILTKNSPLYVQFYVSKYCHQNCKMCNIVESNSDLVPFESKNINKIADNLVKIGAGVVLLTGGEPLLRGDIDKIVKVFKSKGLDVRMQSAGLISKKDLLKRCVKNGARDINISLDSLDEGLSDKINGAKGSWRNAIKSIALVSKIFPKNNSICALGCVLSPYNIDEIEYLLEFATKIGWWVSLVPAHVNKSGEVLKFRSQDKSFSFDKKSAIKVSQLIKRLKAMKKEGYLLFDSNDYLDSMENYVNQGRVTWRENEVCDSPNLYFAILPDASFAPCCDYRFSEKVYLYDNKFPKIFNSRKFRQDVDCITKKCKGCNYGSYPEISLSVRSGSTFWERLLLNFKSKRVGLKSFSEKELFDLIKRIKGNNSKYYNKIITSK